MAFAPNLAIGRKLLQQGADALILEGFEAGGHIGAVATSVLAQEILPEMADDMIFIAGGIGHGKAIRAYLDMGASGVQIGTRFACATESIAHPNFKNAFIKAAARDAQITPQVSHEFPVIPVRALNNKATSEFIAKQKQTIAAYHQGSIDKKQAILQIEHFWAGALKRAVIDGDTEYGSLMAGQSVGMVTAIEPITTIIATLIKDIDTQL